MSMAAFQHAYADLAASPKLCLAVRADAAAALAPYALDARDRARLAKAVWQQGMDANCTLYRATRITALDTVLPQTLKALRPVLRELLDAYWEAHPVHEVRFAYEAARFVAWLEGQPNVNDEILSLARQELATDETRLHA